MELNFKNMTKVFALGNGESRKTLDLDVLKTKGKVYGCNAIYRDSMVDALVVVDGGMMHEVYSSGYALQNKCYFRSWSKLPAMAYDALIDINLFEGWHDAMHTENEKCHRTQFVMNGTDPNQMMKLLYLAKKLAEEEGREFDEIDIRQKLGTHQQWVTWVEDIDKVEIIPEDYSGWSAGPIAVRMAIEDNNPTDVYLIGFDLGSNTGLVNNVYKGTSNYVAQDANEIPAVNWIKQHQQNFKAFPDVTFWKVNPAPLGTDKISQEVEEWKEYENVKYISIKDIDNI